MAKVAAKKDSKETPKSAKIGQTEGRGRSKVREGLVVSDKMSKTIVVAVTRLEQHPFYGKYVHITKRYYAHDEKEECNIGDLVKIVETRPLSKLKRWKLSSIVRKVDAGLEKIAESVQANS